jgi:hypothetical protein
MSALSGRRAHGCTTQDAVATANCGEGMPTWLSTLAIPDLIGKPLKASHEGGRSVISMPLSSMPLYSIRVSPYKMY